MVRGLGWMLTWSAATRRSFPVARALAADPPVMLMDEPFSAVDPQVREQFHEEFLALQTQISKTIVLVTHYIGEAVRLGDQIAVLRPGGVLAQLATSRELLTSPADGFVTSFLGRHAGERGLAFWGAA